MGQPARTRQFVLLLNVFEDEALARVTKEKGFFSRSEALRYLIRREDDPELGKRLTEEESKDSSQK